MRLHLFWVFPSVVAKVRTRQLPPLLSIQLVLVNVDSGQDILDVIDGITIDRSLLPSTNLSVKAVPTSNVTTIQFDYDDQINFQTETVAPYALCGGTQGANLAPCPPVVFAIGSHTLTATGKRSGNNNTTASVRTVQFSVVNTMASPTFVAAATVGSIGGLPWVETFSGLPNKTQSDMGTTAWTVSRSTGKFDVQNGALVINGGGVEGVFQTGVIAIPGSVDVSVDVRSQGPLEANQDYIRIYAKVNNGPELLVGEVKGVQNAVTTLFRKFSGSTISIVIRAFVSAGDEFYTIDNVRVVHSILDPVPAPVPVRAPVLVPVAQPANTRPFSLNGSWTIFQNQSLAGRHEACFVMVGDKAYLMGGRETKDVDIFDPASRSWSKGTEAPQQLHHMQCVTLNGKIYLAAAWTGGFPREKNVDVMWVYDTANNQWSSRNAIPEPRRRGSAAVVVDGTKIWVSHGNRGGHESGNHSTSYGWIDYYDTATDTWVLGDQAGFPDAPHPRDHTGGALVNGRICVSGGRDGGRDRTWPNVAPTDCFDPVSKTWSVEANIPQNRGGSAYGTSCDGKLIVAGGERPISNRVDVFDGKNWQTFRNGLVDSRHGTGLGIDCNRNLIYIASGSPNNGGGQASSLEIYTP